MSPCPAVRVRRLPPSSQPSSSGRGHLPRGRLRRFRLPTEVLRSAGCSCPISMGVLVRKLSLNFCIRDSTVSCVTSGAATPAQGLWLEKSTVSPLPTKTFPCVSQSRVLGQELCQHPLGSPRDPSGTFQILPKPQKLENCEFREIAFSTPLSSVLDYSLPLPHVCLEASCPYPS